MKLLIYLSFIIFLSIGNSIAADKKDCSKLKKFSKNQIICKAFNLKAETIITTVKIKKKTVNIIKKTNNVIKKKL